MTASTCLRHATRRHTEPVQPDGPALELDQDVWLPLHDAVTRVGHSLGSDLQLEDHTVSQRHAILIATEVGVVLLDDRSATGTYVNGARTTRRMLEDGDEVTLGRVTFRFAEA
jgi:pSer/pThr/pTyr-binding forkhead associated (FHA) protein